jgi:hypothetical protein
MSTDTTPAASTEIAVVSPATMALFASMAVGIPESNDEEAYENIVLQLLGANDADELNAPWDTTGAEGLAGKRLKIESMTRRASDFAEGLRMYIVCKGVNLESGEKFVWTTGGVSNVAQLARIHHLGGLPAIVEIVIADTPTARGNRPQHLRVLAFGGSK